MVTDPIADYLTRIRNAQMANHRVVEIPASNLKKRITEILYDKGYILKYKFEEDKKQCVIICIGKIGYGYDNDFIDFIKFDSYFHQSGGYHKSFQCRITGHCIGCGGYSFFSESLAVWSRSLRQSRNCGDCPKWQEL